MLTTTTATATASRRAGRWTTTPFQVVEPLHNNSNKQQPIKNPQGQSPANSSSRTVSLTPCSSMDTGDNKTTTSTTSTTLEVPDLLQSLFGLESLSFAASPIIEEEGGDDDNDGDNEENEGRIQGTGGATTEVDVPRCVKVDEKTSPELLSPTPATEETGSPTLPSKTVVQELESQDELRELLLSHPQLRLQQHQQSRRPSLLPPRTKKKTTSKRLKAAAKKVFMPFSSSSKSTTNSNKSTIRPKSKHGSNSQGVANTDHPHLLTIDAPSSQDRPPISALSSFAFDDEDSSQAMTAAKDGNVSTSHRVATTASADVPTTSSGMNNFVPTNHHDDPSSDVLGQMRRTAQQQQWAVQETTQEIQDLQSQLAASLTKYQKQLQNLEATQQKLLGWSSSMMLLPDTTTVNNNIKKNTMVDNGDGSNALMKPPSSSSRVLQHSDSGSFMRVGDLDLDVDDIHERHDSLSSLSQSVHAQNTGSTSRRLSAISTATATQSLPDFLLMDHHLLRIMPQLMKKGYELAIDEGDRYAATRDTAKLLATQPPRSTSQHHSNGTVVIPSWPIVPWTAAWDHNILIWSGRVSHEGFGHTWPVVKGRAILNTSARSALDCLWDSKTVTQYNPMCVGRDDVYILQDDIHTTDQESPYGFAGCAKIVRSLNKHRLLPKAIEMKSLLYAKPLTFDNDDDGSNNIVISTPDSLQKNGDLESYILVSRSVWENDSATLDAATAKAVIRTEMLLGCTILRAIDANSCEITQMSHVHSPGVPELLARRAAPGQCLSLMKALQAMFPVPGC